MDRNLPLPVQQHQYNREYYHWQWCGINTYDSNSTTIIGNNFIDNWLTDTSTVNSANIVMATTIYTCGPAALATVMKHLGVNATEMELAQWAGTDETGTSMWGLTQAASYKGLNAKGFIINDTSQLKTDYIVVLNINGVYHYNIIRNITNTTVYLTDPNLGDIEMSLDKFKELFTGYVLVIANGTIQINATNMTEQMKNIKGMWHWEIVTHYADWVPPRIVYDYHVRYIVYWVPVGVSVSYGRYRVNIWGSIGFYIYYPIINIRWAQRYWKFEYYTPRYVLGYFSRVWTTREWVPDSGDYNIIGMAGGFHPGMQYNIENERQIVYGGGKIFLGGVMCVGAAICTPLAPVSFPLTYFGGFFLRNGWVDIDNANKNPAWVPVNS